MAGRWNRQQCCDAIRSVRPLFDRDERDCRVNDFSADPRRTDGFDFSGPKIGLPEPAAGQLGGLRANSAIYDVLWRTMMYRETRSASGIGKQKKSPRKPHITCYLFVCEFPLCIFCNLNLRFITPYVFSTGLDVKRWISGGPVGRFAAEIRFSSFVSRYNTSI